METPAKVLKSFCTTHEAAQLLGVSVRMAQLWSEGGLLQAWKTEGGHRRISRQSVERVLATAPGFLPGHKRQARDRLTILVIDHDPSVLQL